MKYFIKTKFAFFDVGGSTELFKRLLRWLREDDKFLS